MSRTPTRWNAPRCVDALHPPHHAPALRTVTVRGAPGGRNLPSRTGHQGHGAGSLRAGSGVCQGETSKITPILMGGQGLLSIRWAGWNPAAHPVKGVHRAHRTRCTVTLCAHIEWSGREWQPLRLAPVERAVRRTGAGVRWVGVHGTVSRAHRCTAPPHHRTTAPDAGMLRTLPHRMERTEWIGRSAPPRSPLPSVHGARWSPSRPLSRGDGPAWCATGSAGRRGTAMSGSGPRRVAASSSVTGTAPYAAGPRQRAVPGARTAPAKGAAGSGQPWGLRA